MDSCIIDAVIVSPQRIGAIRCPTVILLAALALLNFLPIRHGRNTWALFRNLGLPGLAV